MSTAISLLHRHCDPDLSGEAISLLLCLFRLRRHLPLRGFVPRNDSIWTSWRTTEMSAAISLLHRHCDPDLSGEAISLFLLSSDCVVTPFLAMTKKDIQQPAYPSLRATERSVAISLFIDSVNVGCSITMLWRHISAKTILITFQTIPLLSSLSFSFESERKEEQINQKFYIRYRISLPQPSRFNTQTKEPFQSGFHHPTRSLRNSPGNKIKRCTNTMQH
jgi:hypothetical protein